jgi:bifunctional DNA-binding transcriptional regulator/antitoxin component of YhaV-PrlF toxin-antitoxin module
VKKKLNGNYTKYYHYEGSGSGRVNIPTAIARDLGLKHKDKVRIVIKTFEGKKGLFISKVEKD